MLQEQLKKIEKEFIKRHPSVFWKDAVHCTCFGEDKENGIPSLPDDILIFLRTSALELVKSVVEGEIKRLKKILPDERMVAEFGDYQAETYDEKMLVRAVLSSSITHLKETLKQI